MRSGSRIRIAASVAPLDVTHGFACPLHARVAIPRLFAGDTSGTAFLR